ncbi:MAG: MarR family transcriptional regulator [Pirellulaceae bacterium]
MFGETLAMRLRGAYLTFHRRANQHFAQFGVTADQFVVLTVVAETEGLTQRELVERVYSDPNTITGMLTRLEQRKLIQRRPHAEDRRARCIFLTAAGRRLQQQLREQDAEVLQTELAAAFDDAECSHLMELLARVPERMRDNRRAADS